MRLVITENITLDGVVEQNEQTGEWFSVASGGADTSHFDEVLRKMMGEEDAQLHGRKTFEAMRGVWPNQTGDTTGVTDHLNSVEASDVESLNLFLLPGMKLCTCKNYARQ